MDRSRCFRLTRRLRSVAVVVAKVVVAAGKAEAAEAPGLKPAEEAAVAPGLKPADEVAAVREPKLAVAAVLEPKSAVAAVRGSLRRVSEPAAALASPHQASALVAALK